MPEYIIFLVMNFCNLPIMLYLDFFFHLVLLFGLHDDVDEADDDDHHARAYSSKNSFEIITDHLFD